MSHGCAPMMNPEKSYRRGCPREATAVAVPEQGKGALDNRGFTLIELLLVCIILGILITLAIPSYNELINIAKVSRCAEEIRGIEKAIDAYQADRGALPNQLSDLGLGTPLDPWGHPYEYHTIANIINGENLGVQYKDFALVNMNSDYDLYSKGVDNASLEKLTENSGLDDIIRGSNGAFVGRGSAF
jgi:prepilin-type N-terminal cleavage/methylation domain-containing protein